MFRRRQRLQIGLSDSNLADLAEYVKVGSVSLLLDYDFLHPRNLLFGTPDYVAGRIEELRDELNLQHLQVWSNFPGMNHDHVMSSVRKFTEEVMPRFMKKAA